MLILSCKLSTVLERLPEVMKKVDDLKFEDRQPIFVTSPVIDHNVLKEVSKYHLMMNVFENNDVFTLARKLGAIDFSCSSATMALSLAEFLGCSDVFLFGQDLCVNEDGKTHGEGAGLGEIQENYLKDNIGVKCYDSKFRSSTSVLVNFSNELERKAKQFNCFIYNTNIKAKRVKGIEFCTPDSLKIKDNIPLYPEYFMRNLKHLPELHEYHKSMGDTLAGLTIFINRIKTCNGDYEKLVEYFNAFINNHRWARVLLQGLCITINLTYTGDSAELYYKRLFDVVHDILVVVQALFFKYKVGVQNFEVVENESN